MFQPTAKVEMPMPDSPHHQLRRALQQTRLHQHICPIYETQEEQLEVAVAFLQIGLERREQCLYIVDENTAEALVAAMRANGIDVDRAQQTGALRSADKQEVHLRDGRFDSDRIIDYLAEVTQMAKEAGFTGFRWIAEMTWQLGGAPGTERLLEYEARLNDFLRDHDACALCQYNRRRFPPEIILGVIRTHPVLIYRGKISHNPYYIPPEDYLQPGHAAREVERLLGNILE